MTASKFDPERIDIDAARQILEEDHYGIEKVKRRKAERSAAELVKRRAGTKANARQ